MRTCTRMRGCSVTSSGRKDRFKYAILVYSSMINKKKIIQIVWKNKYNGQKMITIPKDCDIQEGEYVEVKRVK